MWFFLAFFFLATHCNASSAVTGAPTGATPPLTRFVGLFPLLCLFSQIPPFSSFEVSTQCFFLVKQQSLSKVDTLLCSSFPVCALPLSSLSPIFCFRLQETFYFPPAGVHPLADENGTFFLLIRSRGGLIVFLWYLASFLSPNPSCCRDP